MSANWEKGFAILKDVPVYNGEFTVGLAGETDTHVEASRKLRVYETPDSGKGQTSNAQWAVKKLKATIGNTASLLFLMWDASNKPRSEIQFGIASIVVAFRAGVICYDGTGPGEGWVFAATGELDAFYAEDYEEKRATFVELFTAANEKMYVQSVATMLVACKINWWKENHHVGQGPASGYYKKVADIIKPKVCKNSTDENFRTLCHTTSKWMSTKEVMKQLGIDHVVASTPIVSGVPGQTFTAAADAGLRVSSNPAGTARLAIVHAMSKIVFRTVQGALMPNAEEYAVVSAEYNKVMASPALYHIGSTYLTGNTIKGRPLGASTNLSAYVDTDFERFLGRAGTYMSHYSSKSTIMKSPHLANSKFKSAPDFDQSYDDLLRTLRTAMKIDIKHLELKTGYSTCLKNYQAVAGAFGLTVNDNIVATLTQAREREIKAAKDAREDEPDVAGGSGE